MRVALVTESFLPAAVRDLVDNAERRHAFGQAGRVAIAGRSWQAVGDELIGHYEAARCLGVYERRAVAA